MKVEVSVEIAATPQRVWAVMVDVERWPEWTASMTRVERLDRGEFGAHSRARVKQPQLPAMTWRVTEFEPEQAFTWEARALAATTTASHRIVARGDAGSTVTLAVTQVGPFMGLFGPMMSRWTRRNVTMEAEGLKRRCEANQEASRA